MGAQLFHADGRTNGYDAATVAFRNFSNAPRKGIQKILDRTVKEYDNENTFLRIQFSITGEKIGPL